jgi:hypothetical protein
VSVTDARRADAARLRTDIDAEDIAASLVGILTVVGKPDQRERASRLLNLLMDGLKPQPA